MKILGIDPGTETIGYGIVEKLHKSKPLRCLGYGTIKTPRGKTRGERLLVLDKGLTKLLGNLKPDVLAVESLFFFKNLKTAMGVSEARGVILLVGTKAKIPIFEFAPLQVKMAVTGYGRAEKRQMQRMVKEILALPEIPKPDDAADGLGLAIACSLIQRPA